MLRNKSVVILSVAAAITAGAFTMLAAANNRQGATTQEVATVTVKAPMSPNKAIPIAVTKGSSFSIELASNMTTGYSWRFAKPIAGAAVVKTGNVYNPPSEAIPGRGSTETWSFTAAEKGKATITLEYVRPWEKGVKPIKTQTFSVTVN